MQTKAYFSCAELRLTFRSWGLGGGECMRLSPSLSPPKKSRSLHSRRYCFHEPWSLYRLFQVLKAIPLTCRVRQFSLQQSLSIFSNGRTRTPELPVVFLSGINRCMFDETDCGCVIASIDLSSWSSFSDERIFLWHWRLFFFRWWILCVEDSYTMGRLCLGYEFKPEHIRSETLTWRYYRKVVVCTDTCNNSAHTHI